MNRTSSLKLFFPITVSLLVGLTVWVGVLVTYLYHKQSNVRLLSEHWSGAEFALATGHGRREEKSLMIDALSEQGEAFAFVQLAIRASQFEAVTVQLSGLPEGHQVQLVWGRRNRPGDSYTMALAPIGKHRYRAQLGLQTDWKDEISGLGILITSTAVLPRVALQQLQLESRWLSPWEIVQKIRRDFTDFQPWSQKSINVLALKQGQYLIRPVPLVLIWLLHSYAVYCLWFYCCMRAKADFTVQGFRALGAMALLAWLVLDGRWQVNLWEQNRQTRLQYAGKSGFTRAAAADDGPLFQYIASVRQVLPTAGGARVLILNEGNLYAVFRSKYHLAPHNTLVCDWPCLSKVLRAGDYLLILNTTIVEAEVQRRLSADPSSLSARLLHQGELGRLFLISAPRGDGLNGSM